jgi:DNA-binding beta-propeller fold protein YncE
MNEKMIGLILILILFAVSAEAKQYEVWTIDQSDTTSDGGGTLYIYNGEDLEGENAPNAVPAVVDLGAGARTLCLAQTGTAPRRPHMFFFNADQTHAVIAFVATGHVLFMNAATRAPIQCVDVGVQAHAAVPAHDQSFVVVANQNGKLLQRINTDFQTNTFALDGAATLNLATCITPNGAPCEDPVLRPSNRPICPVIDRNDSFTFITLAGGGLFVVDSRATPMAIVGEYDRTVVHPEGCGGTQARGRMYINSGGALESDLYSFPLSGYSPLNPANVPAPSLIFTHDGANADSHGVVTTKHERFLWVAERFSNNVFIVDTFSNTLVNQFSLTGDVSLDPAPDLMDISPTGNRIFFSMRGPNPLTGNNPLFNNAVGNTPGLGIIRVTSNGANGELFARVPISHLVGGIERADPHGLKVRISEED